MSKYIYKENNNWMAIIVVYIDDNNIIETFDEISKASTLFKNVFEMKDIGITKLCLGLQLEHKKIEYLSINKLYWKSFKKI